MNQPEIEIAIATPYESLDAMTVVYNNLTRQYGQTLEGDPLTNLLDKADEFVLRGCETGKILDDPDERWEAQNMLNFWAKILYRHRYTSGDEPLMAELAPFGSFEPTHADNVPIPFQVPPEPPDVYVGRERFLSDLKQRLLSGRDIVLCSSPGTGKTMLAAKLSHDPELKRKYPDGVLWAKLGDQPDVSTILRQWAKALNIHTSEADWLGYEHSATVIRQALARRRMLLVIDDAWQADIALVLKLGGPNCAHIVTTYLMSVALGFEVKSVVMVPGFSREEGVRFLAQQAPKAIKGQEDAAAELVESLDSSPLALSLLANYCRQHGLNGSRLDLKRLRGHLLKEKKAIEGEQSATLIKDPYNEVQTQASLVAAISWCFEQLKPDEQYVLQAFAAFPPKPNSFSGDAARFITEGRSISVLLDWGLLHEFSDDRYSLHRSISDFLKSRTHALKVNKAEKRMVQFFLERVKTQATNLHVLEQEEKNILAALDVAYKRGMWAVVVEGTNALFGYFDRQGLYVLAKKTLAQAHEAAKKAKDDRSLAAILLKLGEINERQSEYVEANKYLQASLKIAESVNDEDVCARALQGLGVVAMAIAQYSDAEGYLRKARELARKIKNTEIECAIETRLGWVERGIGKFKRSRERTERALKLAQRLHYIRQIAELELSLGVLYFFEEKYEEARDHDLKGLDYAEKAQDKRLQCGLHQALGGVEIELKHFAEAEDHLMKALHLATEIGHRWYSGVIWKELGKLRMRQGFPNDAYSAFNKAVEIAREVNSSELLGLSLYGLARVAAFQKNYAEARLQARTSLNIFEQIGHHKKEAVRAWFESINGSTSN